MIFSVCKQYTQLRKTGKKYYATFSERVSRGGQRDTRVSGLCWPGGHLVGRQIPRPSAPDPVNQTPAERWESPRHLGL